TVIEQQKKEDPNSILIDAGDYSMGTLFQTVNGSEALELRIMGFMGHEISTFGNHEFDFRSGGLSKSLFAAKRSKDKIPKLVASNFIFPNLQDGSQKAKGIADLKNAFQELDIQPLTIIEKNGLKIGFIGLMGKEADEDAPMSGVEFQNIVEAAKPLVQKLKEQKVDLIIALSHSGTFADKSKSEDEILAKEVGDIDVIISGHTHTTLNQPILHGQTLIASSGSYGRNLGKLVIEPAANNRWQLKEYKIIPINDQIKENVLVNQKIVQYKQLVQSEYLKQFGLQFDEVIAYSPFDFVEYSKLGRQLKEEPIGNLIGDSYIESVRYFEHDSSKPITAAVVPVGMIRDSIVKGQLTTPMVYKISPLGIGPDEVAGYPIVDLYLTGKELWAVAEVDASVSPIMPDAQLYLAGLSYTINQNRMIFNRVTDLVLVDKSGNKTEIDNNKLYRVVSGLYSAQMLPVVRKKSMGLLSIEPKDKDGNIITDFEKQIIYTDSAKTKELKEWFAIAHYLQSFPKVNGVAQISDLYQSTNNRKNVENSLNLVSMLKQSNGIGISIYSIIVLILLGVVFGVTRLKRRK
ncbi:MAG: bifunctional metallophosphatase/5'-nucleotidase, partial [Leptonema sp. (in: Bacteria)]|nr:bifunctional metallophosphatase/5'-nucleotidase [Leptonema sp. (in: bacteria)]